MEAVVSRPALEMAVRRQWKRPCGSTKLGVFSWSDDDARGGTYSAGEDCSDVGGEDASQGISPWASPTASACSAPLGSSAAASPSVFALPPACSSVHAPDEAEAELMPSAIRHEPTPQATPSEATANLDKRIDGMLSELRTATKVKTLGRIARILDGRRAASARGGELLAPRLAEAA